VDVVTLIASVILLIEIPWSMISAIRITRRYRVRLVESRIFRWLTGAVLWVAFVGGGAIGILVLYAFGRVFAPQAIPTLGPGVFTTLLAIALIALIALPIALDHELSRIARSADPSVTEL
jgi:hypothetical protein